MARGRLAPSSSAGALPCGTGPGAPVSRASRGRSRSPASAPAAPLRRDAPARLPYATGAVPDLSTAEARETALTNFTLDIFAPSNRASVASRLRTCERLLEVWSLQMSPPTPKAIVALGASLKAGRYRSASVYLSTYKSWALRQGHDWTAPLQQSMQDAIRSCERGLGGPVKARPLPFARLSELPGGDEPWVQGGPLRPRNAIVIGSWFLTRELELSSASAASLELSFPSPGIPQVRFHLPASKSDVLATGVAREHGCSCRGGPSAACPAHAAWDHLTFLRERFPTYWQPSSSPMDLPLFPAASGAACSKDAMTATIVRAATLLGVELSAPDGSERVAGHSLRATGAQGLAAAGVDTWAIELLGRWGGEAVRGYIRDARLADASAMARRVSDSAPLEVLVRRILAEQLGSGLLAGGLPPPGAAAGSGGGPPFSTMAREPGSPGLPVASYEVSAPLGPALRASLSEPLAAEVTLAQLAASSAGSESTFVMNSVTGVAHMVAIGFDDSPPNEWSSACGWRFGISIWRAAPVQLSYEELPKAPQLLCARCLPEFRRAAMQALVLQEL